MLTATIMEVSPRAVIRLEGELDIATTAEISAVVQAVLDEGSRRIVLDLSSLAFADSTGLAGIARLSRQASERGSTLAICNPDPLTSKVLALIGLDASLEVLVT